MRASSEEGDGVGVLCLSKDCFVMLQKNGSIPEQTQQHARRASQLYKDEDEKRELEEKTAVGVQTASLAPPPPPPPKPPLLRII